MIRRAREEVKPGESGRDKRERGAEDFNHALARVLTRPSFVCSDTKGNVMWQSGKP